MQSLLQLKSINCYIFWVCVCSPRYPACNAHAPYCHLCPVQLYHIFPHYLINAKLKKKKLLKTKRVFWFHLRSLYLSIKFMKIRPVRTDLLHADGRTDRYDEDNSRCSQFCESAKKFSLYRTVNTSPLHYKNSLLTVVTEIIVFGLIIIRSMWQP